jgi:hypothetical protein
MPFIPPRRLAFILCTLAISTTHAAEGAEIGGSIRFSDENFSFTVQTVDQGLRLQSRGCNNFDLTLLPADRNAAILLRDRDGRSLGTIGNERMIETRTCGGDRYTTALTFNAPTSIKWTPQSDELIGGKKVKYAAQLTPQRMIFDPPIELTIYEKNSRARPIRIADVATAEFQNGLPITYSSNSLHFATPAGTIERENGFAADDEFFLESETQHFKRPANGAGEEIAFEAPSAQAPTSVSLYYPSGGPHILAFTADERSREPTPVKSLRIDDEQLLTPQFAIAHSDPMTIRRGFLPFASADQVTQGTVQVVLGSPGSEVTHVRVTSSDPTGVQIATSGSDAFAPAVDIPKVAGGEPIDLVIRVRAPAAAALGSHNFTLSVTSDGGLRREVPITLDISDPYSRTRTGLLGAMVALLILLVVGTLIKRNRRESHAADRRSIFFQKHYGDYSEIREQIELALASELTSLKVTEVLEAFTEKQLESALTAQQWGTVQQLASQQKAREALETLDRALARLEG